MTDVYFIGSLLLLLGAIICISIALTSLIMDGGKTITVSFFLLSIPFLLSAYATHTIWDERLEKEKAAFEKNATYYEVTEETKKEIEKYCEETHVKRSTQRNCMRNAARSLKYGEKYDIFEPSSVVIKKSGEKPK